MGKPLIIVESPAKTKTLKNLLGGKYELEASYGHVRDLPKKEFGVDLEHDFHPTYVPLTDRKNHIKRLKDATKKADEVYIATDPDREGEAIAWHLQEALNLKDPKRIEFNEITESAVKRALEHPRVIDMDRVNAQQARRVVDRIVGYKLSPLLWKKLGNKQLSAGRVQSVAVRLIVEREREIRAFAAEEYWSITAKLTPEDKVQPFEADLRSKGEKKLEITNQEQADGILGELQGAKYIVKSIKRNQRKRSPAPPFITSTMQQEASRKIGFGAKMTMQTAQKLYEGIELGGAGSVGLITYMRTDSTRIADEAKTAAEQLIRSRFGADYVGSGRKAKAGKRVQDAHEAVRPTDPHRTPDAVKSFLSPQQFKLYDLIWKRFIASQMADSLSDVTTVDISANDYIFRATGSVPTFAGFTAVYTEGKDTMEVEDDENPPLPLLNENDPLRLLDLHPDQHFTQPPPRYTEATLVKALEQNGIGRPSTYATILSVVVDRGYTTLEKKVFSPTPLGEVVSDYLVETFPDTFDIQFTAKMEDDLDQIAEEGRDWVAVVSGFYGPLEVRLSGASNGEQKDIVSDKICPNCGKPMVVKSSKRGAFLGCSGYPECKTIISLDRPADKETDKMCPNCGKPMVIKTGRRGEFLACTGYPECKTAMSVDGKIMPEDKPTDKVCPNCGKPMVIKTGRNGEFLACTGYPKCKTALPLVTSDIPCPTCGEGRMVEKKSKKGKTFWSCSRYPACKTATWDKPTGEKCPTCGDAMVLSNTKTHGERVKCQSKTCNFVQSDEPDKVAV